MRVMLVWEVPVKVMKIEYENVLKFKATRYPFRLDMEKGKK